VLKAYIEEKGAGRDEWNGNGVHVIGICIDFVGIFIIDLLVWRTFGFFNFWFFNVF